MKPLASSKANRPVNATSFSEIRINDGTITVDDAARGMTETLKDVELALAWPSISKSFAATGHFVWHDQTVDSAVTLTDFAAARFFYGDTTSVYTDPRYAAGTSVGTGISAATDTFGGLVGIHCLEEIRLPNPIVSIDGIALREFDFIDIGALIETSGAVPVVIKSLVFPSSGAIGRSAAPVSVPT